MTLGNRIKEIRKSHALTQVEFSNKICLSQPHLSKVESDEENLSKSALRLVSIIFNVSEDWIKTGKQE